jgi:hypothetical protein
LRVVHLTSEGFFYCHGIGSEAIGRKLNATIAIELGSKGLDEPAGSLGIPLAYQEGRDQLALGIEGHEDVLIANLGVVPLLIVKPLLLLLAEGPDFIGLDQTGVKASHSLVQDRLAPFAHFDQEPQDWVLS